MPGGSGLHREEMCEPLAEWILSRAYETPRIASICTGLYALASTGLLDGREVTTHWRVAHELMRRYPSLRVNHKRRLIKDGSFYTSAGLTAGVDLALALIEADYGKQVALSVSQDLMLYLAPQNRPNENSLGADEGTQPIDCFGELVAWIMRNLHENLTVESMARQSGMCPTNFTRSFKSVFGHTPGEFVENIRLHEARRRLSSRGKTVRSVAASVGFTNATAFRGRSRDASVRVRVSTCKAQRRRAHHCGPRWARLAAPSCIAALACALILKSGGRSSFGRAQNRASTRLLSFFSDSRDGR